MDHGHHHGHGNGSMPDMDMGMKMYFHVGYDKNILIYGWDATCPGRMTGTIVAVVLLGIFYEWTKFLRLTLVQDSVSKTNSSPPPIEEEESFWSKYGGHIIQSLLYGLQVAVSFTLMLFAMTFNVWIFGGVVIGMAMGYLIFSSPRKRGDRSSRQLNFNVNDCCN